MSYRIPFNKPFLTGNETKFIEEAVASGHLAGNGKYTQKCQEFFAAAFGFKHCLLTTSCTDALEMSAILLDIGPGDEVIVPAYTFVSTANAFALRGAKIVFADSKQENPNIDPASIEELITSKTKAIVVVHYAGVACDMDQIMAVANKHKIFVIEDAAQAIDSYYKGKPLGSIGHMGTFSFHETKNVIAGEGGLLVINDTQFVKRAEIIWEKGTNRKAFFQGEVDKYTWVDLGSSFLPGEITAAFLFAQLENLTRIQKTRLEIWERYNKALLPLKEIEIKLPHIPDYATNNGHMFYLVLQNKKQRDELIAHLKSKSILAVFHYLSLNKSEFYRNQGYYKETNLENADFFSDRLLRLPFYYNLTKKEQMDVIAEIKSFFDL